MNPTIAITSVATPASANNMNRGRVAGACMFTQVVLDILYAWTVFRGPLAKLHRFSESQTMAPYRYSLLALPLGTVVTGVIQHRKGPCYVENISGILLATGMLLASFSAIALWGLIFADGILGGLGVGFGYIAPIATCIKWFPDRHGFIAGLSVLGSGIGPVFYGPFLQSLIGREPAQFGETISRTFLVLALLFYVTLLGSAQFYRVPPPSRTPVGFVPIHTAAASGKAAKAQDAAIPAREGGVRSMLGTWQFYVLYVLYFLGASVGLTAIGMAAPLLDAAGAAAAAVSIGIAVGLVSAFNAGGQPSSCAVSDRYRRKTVAMAISAISVIACLVFLRSVAGFWPVMIWTSSGGIFVWRLAGTHAIADCRLLRAKTC